MSDTAIRVENVSDANSAPLKKIFMGIWAFVIRVEDAK
jgi:hypothetical protein